MSKWTNDPNRLGSQKSNEAIPLLQDAPSDGKQYIRKDGQWIEVNAMRGRALFVSATDPSLTEDVQVDDVWLKKP